jgi:hypothetical protein
MVCCLSSKQLTKAFVVRAQAQLAEGDLQTPFEMFLESRCIGSWLNKSRKLHVIRFLSLVAHTQKDLARKIVWMSHVLLSERRTDHVGGKLCLASAAFRFARLCPSFIHYHE